MALDWPDCADAAANLIDLCRRLGTTLATAESCTGGLIGAVLTAVPGASEAYAGGVVSYANGVKARALGVPAALIDSLGAVSAPVAEAMAVGALKQTGADFAVAVTGVAGPGGGTPEKPVGLVFVAVAEGGKPLCVKRFDFAGDRAAVRAQTVAAAIEMLTFSIKEKREVQNARH